RRFSLTRRSHWPCASVWGERSFQADSFWLALPRRFCQTSTCLLLASVFLTKISSAIEGSVTHFFSLLLSRCLAHAGIVGYTAVSASLSGSYFFPQPLIDYSTRSRTAGGQCT